MDVQKVGVLMKKLRLLDMIKENTLPGRLNVLITTQADLKMGIETIVKRITDIEGCEALASTIKEFHNLLHRRIKVKMVTTPL